MLLSREQILAQRLPIETVDVPWLQGMQIIVRALPQHVTEKSVKQDDAHWKAFIFVNAVVDESGQRLYQDGDAQTIADTVDRALIDFVVSKAYSLTVIPPERQEAIKKNWQTLRTAKSGESPSPSDTPTPP